MDYRIYPTRSVNNKLSLDNTTGGTTTAWVDSDSDTVDFTTCIISNTGSEIAYILVYYGGSQILPTITGDTNGFPLQAGDSIEIETPSKGVRGLSTVTGTTLNVLGGYRA